MPEEMTEGEFYISVKHRLTEHLCACGCGTEVSLPLGRSEWSITYGWRLSEFMAFDWELAFAVRVAIT